CGMLVHREHLLGLFVLLLTFYRKGALFSIPFGFYWIINTPDTEYENLIEAINNQIKKLHEFRESLIYEAVTGKIDVRGFRKGE
ncbi:restriction endonuclease subunit S, partial [Geobacillus stearothermophilus]|uniref:restriction endonuclease subunit S n=1 Tax=Geobacillus stearothermophilus TaxID=1422 RepID=UPI000F17655D